LAPMALTGELYEAVVKIVDDRVGEIKVAREMYDRLVGAISELTEAQKRTELSLSTLSERTTRLEESMEKLAEAQKLTDQRLRELAEAQKRTEDAVAKLASAVGRLSDTIGHDLESIARVSVPDWLELHVGVKVPSLERRIFTIDGEEVEIDLYGEGVKRGVPVSVLGEARSSIHGRDVAAFAGTADRLGGKLSRQVVKLLFGYWIHPSAESEARKLGVYVMAPPSSYPKPRSTKRRGSIRSRPRRSL